MNSRSAMITVSATTLLLAFTGALAQTTPSTLPGSLPPSLDNFYPPSAQGPVYLMAMHAMSTPMSGMVTDMLEGDMANTRTNFEKFKQEYLKVSKMVPEWESQFPISPVDQLASALESGDQGQVMGVLEGIGRNCHGCHITAMPLAQYKYHWGDFGDITATDPVTGQSVPFTNFMQMIESDMTGIGNDLGQNQPDAARTHAEGFAKRMNALKETCDGCHETERAYFVDPKVMGMIEQLQATMQQEQANPQAVGELLQGIGMESCHKCHLVHIPAAYSKHVMQAK